MKYVAKLILLSKSSNIITLKNYFRMIIVCMLSAVLQLPFGE